MEKIVQESKGTLMPELEKRGRGRPRKHPVADETLPKKGRGRPRKTPVCTDDSVVKRGRGRPRKYPIAERELLPNGEIKANFRKVDSCHLMKHLLNYFTKLMIVHSQLAKETSKYEVVFNRMKNLDFQMAEVCRIVLAREFDLNEEESDLEKVA